MYEFELELCIQFTGLGAELIHPPLSADAISGAVEDRAQWAHRWFVDTPYPRPPMLSVAWCPPSVDAHCDNEVINIFVCVWQSVYR